MKGVVDDVKGDGCSLSPRSEFAVRTQRQVENGRSFIGRSWSNVKTEKPKLTRRKGI